MATAARATGATKARSTGASRQSTASGEVDSPGQDYELPVLHAKVPEQLANTAFWMGLIGAVAIGAVELPVAALVGAGVIVARHRRQA